MLPSGTRLGPYEVLGLIGEGGMGQVYRATDTRLERAVAIKVLPAALAADKQRRDQSAGLQVNHVVQRQCSRVESPTDEEGVKWP